MYHLRAKGVDERMINAHYYSCYEGYRPTGRFRFVGTISPWARYRSPGIFGDNDF